MNLCRVKGDNWNESIVLNQSNLFLSLWSLSIHRSAVGDLHSRVNLCRLIEHNWNESNVLNHSNLFLSVRPLSTHCETEVRNRGLIQLHICVSPLVLPSVMRESIN